MSSKKYHTVYKTTNLVNGKCYVGVHSTNKIDDGYIGCGFRVTWDLDKVKHNVGIRAAFKKYGVENFKKEILFVYDSRDEALKKEAEIVNLEWVKSDRNYNLCLGGRSPKGYVHTPERAKQMLEYRVKNFVVVNVKTGEIYYVKNINEWSRENNLSSRNGASKLHAVLRGKAILLQNTWWACREKDWTGKAIIREDRNNAPKVHKNTILISPEGESVFIPDLKKFCKLNKYSYSSFLRIINGERLKAEYWTVSIENHRKAVSYFKLDGEIIKVYNIKEYCKNNNIDSKYMGQLKNKKISKYKGYTLHEE